MVTAIVLVRAEIQRIPEVAEMIAQIPRVSEVYSVTGSSTWWPWSGSAAMRNSPTSSPVG